MADLITMLQAAAGAGGVTPAGYQISRSLRFNSADSAYLSRTPASASNRDTMTFSFWAKLSGLATANRIRLFSQYRNAGADQFWVSFNTAANVFDVASYTSSSFTLRLITTQVFRDLSAWGHWVVAIDTTQATLSNRAKIYYNGVQITALSTATYPNQNTDMEWNNTEAHFIGTRDNSAEFYNGYLTEINFIDGSALTPSSFGETNPTTGVWSPIAYAGSYGTNGFYLNFSDNTSTTTLGEDQAGSNNWTPNNFSVTAGAGNDSLVDSPTPYGTDTGAGGEVRGNYATFNPLAVNANSGQVTFSNGNLNLVYSATATYSSTIATIGVSSGKWYWEVTQTASSQNPNIGVVRDGDSLANYLGQTANGYSYYGGTGDKYNNAIGVSYGASFAANDVIGVALDMDAGTITFYKNGVSQGQAYSGLSGLFYPAVSDGDSSATVAFVVNFGQRPFAYTAPSGFKALVTTNLPEPTVVQGDDYFNTVLYTGTGSSLGVTGVGFQPDWVWIKERNGVADHALYDAVRGVQQQLESNTTTDETTEATGLTAFGSDGFTVGSLAQVNTSTDTYVAWNWKESTTSKFDIVTYTGNGTARTISHNLGVVPNMIIVKARTTASTDQGWPVYHSANTANPETDYLLLNSDAATADLDTVWNDTAPTSSVFSVGTNALVNANNDTYVAYVFANVAGYSAFGSYTGNGSADGPFVYTGFRPAFVMLKRTDSTSNWTILDFARIGYNVDNNPLFPNLSDAETTTDLADLLSNGFKLRSTDASVNASGGTYVFAAFSSNPFKFALAR